MAQRGGSSTADGDGSGQTSYGWVLWAAGAMLAIAAMAAAVWLLPPVFTETSKPLPEDKRLTAENNVRDTLIKAIGGLVLLGGLFYTAKTARQGTRTLELSQQTLAHSRQVHLAERFNGAVDQLGRDKSRHVHTGGIMTLAAIAREEPSFVAPITEILTAFIKEHARPPDNGDKDAAEQGAKPVSGEPASADADTKPTCEPGTCRFPKPHTDVQAAVTALGRRFRVSRDTGLEGGPPGLPEVELDLSDVDLHGIDLHGLDFRLADLRSADLRCSKAYEVQLQGTDLHNAKLQNANLGNARLDAADLGSANLTSAKLGGATLDLAILEDTTLNPSESQDMKVKGAIYNDFTWSTRAGYDLHRAEAVNSQRHWVNAEKCREARKEQLRLLKRRVSGR